MPARPVALQILLLFPWFFTASAFPAHAEIVTNDVAPAFTLRDGDNRMVICKEILKRKPILLSFFFTECKPCKKEIPELEKLNEKYKDKMQFYLIATDKEGAHAVKPYIQRMNITITVLLDKYQDVVHDFGITKYPTLYIIGRDGRVKYFCAGYDPANIEKIEEYIKTNL